MSKIVDTNGNLSTSYYDRDNQRIGINTDTPAYTHDVNGDGRITKNAFLATDIAKSIVKIGHPDGGSSASYHPINLFGGPQSGWNSAFMGIDSPNGRLNLYPFSGQGKFDHFSVDFDNASKAAGTAKATIQGKVGIGTETPEDILHLEADNPRMRFDDTSTSNNGRITLDNTALRIEADPDNAEANSQIKFQVDNDLKMNIVDTGYVGIGLSNPLARIDAADVPRTGTHDNAGAKYYFTGTYGQVSNGFEIVHTNGTAGVGIGWEGMYSTGTNGNNDFFIRSQQHVIFQPTDGTNYFNYYMRYNAFYPNNDNNANLGLSTRRWKAVYAINGTIQTSDERLKDNITPIEYGLDEVLRLNPVSYDWKDGSGKDKLGLIAQEVQEVIPNIVDGDEDENLGLNYAELVPVLVKAVQEQSEQISELKARVAELEA